MTKVAVIGVGHLGKQHARLYAELGGLVGVVDIQKARAEEIAGVYKTTHYTDYHDLFGKVDAVSLAVPTVDHAQSAWISSNTASTSWSRSRWPRRSNRRAR